MNVKQMLLRERGRMSIVGEFSLFLLFLFLFLLFFHVCGRSLTALLILGGLGVSSLLAEALSEPLGQAGTGPLGPVFVLLLPHGLQGLGPDDLPASLVQLLPVIVGSGVGTPLVLGVHANLGRVLAGQSLGVETLLHGLLSELDLLSLLQFLELVVLGHLPLLKVVFVGLQGDNDVEQLLSLVLQLVRVHGV